MASLYLVSSGMADSWCLLRSNYLTIPSTGEKNLSNQGNMTSITCCCVAVNFETFPSEYWLLTKSIQGQYQVELNECGMEELFSDSRKAAKPAEQFKCLVACCLCSIGFRISVNDFGRINKINIFQVKIFLGSLKAWLELTKIRPVGLLKICSLRHLLKNRSLSLQNQTCLSWFAPRWCYVVTQLNTIWITRQQGLPEEKTTELSSISFTKTKLWYTYIKLFPNPVARTAKPSFLLSKWETSLFLLSLWHQPSKIKSRQLIKSKTFSRKKYSDINAILAWAAKLWMSLSVT